MGHAQSDEEQGDQAGGGIAKIASARPEEISCQGDRKQQREGGTGAQYLQGYLAVNAEHSESAPGGCPERSMAHSFDEGMVLKKVCREEQQESYQRSARPDDEGCNAANGSDVQHEAES